MSTRHPVAILLLLLLVGALLGSILNEVLAPVFPVLRHSAGGGLSPSTLALPPVVQQHPFWVAQLSAADHAR